MENGLVDTVGEGDNGRAIDKEALTYIHYHVQNGLFWWLRWERNCLRCGRPGFNH